MCGIAGLAGTVGSRRRRCSRRISDAITHRGPDEAGFYEDEHVALAIRRLAIIDVAGGHQPYVNEAGTVHVVFNGEIYGFAALRDRLERAGHRFTSHTDGEVIAHAYEEYGERFIEELDGMFAFALWDAVAQPLVLARDRLGKKPLFVAPHADGSLSFASEMGRSCSTRGSSARSTRCRSPTTSSYGYVPSPHTILKGVRKLEPGSR